MDLFFISESFSSFLAGRFPREHRESMSRILEEDCNNAFTSTLTVFSTASSQESWFRPRVSNWARMEGLRPSWKYRIMVSLFRVAAGSNSRRTACRYSRWAAQSRTSSSWCWKSLLIFPQYASTKALESLKLQRRNALNLSHVTGTGVSASCLCLYCCQRKLIRSRRKDVAKGIWVGLIVLAVAK